MLTGTSLKLQGTNAQMKAINRMDAGIEGLKSIQLLVFWSSGACMFRSLWLLALSRAHGWALS